MRTLSADDVRGIHEVLIQDFSDSGDPMGPSGVRSDHLLESAVSRQHTGFAGKLKYDTAVLNAATLCFGICCDHPFHNGNKRTALVATLCHLDVNELTLEEDTSQHELYELMIHVARHGFSTSKDKRDDSDVEVQGLGKWLRKRSRRIEKGERSITCRQLKTIMQKYGYAYENQSANQVDIVRYTRRTLWLGIGPREKRERIMRIPYPRDGAVVGRETLRELRERCELTDKHGIDSKNFYTEHRTPDYFVARYRKTLKLLARV
jgi:death on curing protein